MQRLNEQAQAYLHAVRCDPHASPAPFKKRYLIFTDEGFPPDSEAYGAHAPLAFTECPGGRIEHARLITGREGSCLKVNVHDVEYGSIFDTFLRRGSGHSDRRHGRFAAASQGAGHTAGNRHGAQAYPPLGAKSGMHILWKRIHATYYVINGFRMDSGPDFPACPGHA